VSAWNARLCRRAQDAATPPHEKVRLLRRAEAVFPWNSAVSFELGRVYFEQGAESMADPAARDDLFRKSIDSYLRSLRLNPASAAAHFGLGQALLYAGYAGLPTPLPYFDEYRRAAELTGHDSQIHYEAGKVLFGHWDRLSPDERDFAAGLLKRSMAGKGQERVLDLLEAWYLAGHDAGLIDRILPEDAAALRTYARFLGERSLSLADRLSALARAEALEVARARTELDRARSAAASLMPAEAAFRAGLALDALGSVKFYQGLAGRDLLDPLEFKALQRGARRVLARSWIEETGSLEDPEGIIAAYVEAEDNPAALGEFEAFLAERRLLDERRAVTPFQSLKTLAFRMGLDFKLGRLSRVTDVEGLLASSSTVLAPSGRSSYARILRLIGQANLELNDAIEAAAFFEKAREVGSDSLDVLLGLERCYSLLEDEAKAAGVRAAIGRLTSPDQIDLGGQALAKGQLTRVDLLTTGGPRAFRLEFTPSEPGTSPLVSVFLDGRAVWEEYGDTGLAEFMGTLGQGRARLEIQAVSAPVNLGRLSISMQIR
jgi:tetratricopeptide (TPR) repeat protein